MRCPELERQAAGSVRGPIPADVALSFIWIILIGFLAGVIARLLSPGPNNPTGFLLTTILGIVGAFVATFLGQTIGWYRADQGAGLIGATVSAPSLCCSSGIGWWQTAPSATP